MYIYVVMVSYLVWEKCVYNTGKTQGIFFPDLSINPALVFVDGRLCLVLYTCTLHTHENTYGKYIYIYTFPCSYWTNSFVLIEWKG